MICHLPSASRQTGKNEKPPAMTLPGAISNYPKTPSPLGDGCPDAIGARVRGKLFCRKYRSKASTPRSKTFPSTWPSPRGEGISLRLLKCFGIVSKLSEQFSRYASSSRSSATLASPRSRPSALRSIWRIRSRVRFNSPPISSRVRGRPSNRPNRSSSTRRSRSWR